MAAAALGAGWDPAALAAFVGANTAGVRSPAAVLAARLSPAELPAPPGRPGYGRRGAANAASKLVACSAPMALRRAAARAVTRSQLAALGRPAGLQRPAATAARRKRPFETAADPGPGCRPGGWMGPPEGEFLNWVPSRRLAVTCAPTLRRP